MKPRIRSIDRTHCFLCDPEPEYTWATSEHFRAVLGVGPIGEGFTLIAAREHVPSMLDLDDDASKDLIEFTAYLRSRLRPLYGPAAIAEHGRIAACVAPVARRHEPHCLHAHRLVFPGHEAIDLRRAAPRLPITNAVDFRTLREASNIAGQYLYTEADDGRCEVGHVQGPLPRQFLRALVAAEQGRPHLADWRARPGFEELEDARRALGLVAAA